MDQNEYEVSVEFASPTTTMSDNKSHWRDFEIVVKTTDAVVWRESVNDDIAKIIITEDAVKSFEWEEAQMWYVQQEQDQE